MKAKIHPKYNKEAAVKCACGSTFKVGSTAEKIDVEICSDCHPFYTGKEKLVDSTGRVDRFKQRMEKTAAMKTVKKPKKTARKDAEKKEEKPKTEEATKKEDKK